MRDAVRPPTGDDLDTDSTATIEEPVASELSLLVSVDGVLGSHPLGAKHTLTIGRSRSNDIVIDHPSISRRHAEMTSGPLSIRDLGSTNGTRLRGKRVPTGAATPFDIGEALHVGEALLLVQRIVTASSGRPWRGLLLDGRLGEECARSSRSAQPFAFARVHVGAEVDVETVEDELEAALRSTDLFADAGHGQMQILLLDTPPGAARMVIDRVVARLRARGLDPRWGVASWPRDGTTAEQLSACAWNAVRTGGGAMNRLRGLIEQIADSTLSVLIRGETGVGKELAAEMIHRLSGRSRAPFVRVNCAALSEQLLESELFGHERGAFTGAIAAKPGLIETADGGTLFLDEVGDLPRALQAKLLRVLEDRVVQRVGAVEGRVVDVRFLSATNRSLEADIAGGAFRRDLYYRLGGVTIEIPPLRDRHDELEGLVAAFVARAASNSHRPTPDVTPAALASLRAHSWPGNIRELRNALERAVLLCGGGPLDVEHLAFSELDRTATGPFLKGDPVVEREGTRPTIPMHEDSLRGEVARIEERRILDALGACGGNQTRAARMLGISRNTLQARMDLFNIPRPRKK